MPKCYSEQEKRYIIQRLKEEAAKCLAQYGIRRTTVDELVKRVNIPKGTFYLFYPSKEILLFEVILELHHNVEQNLMEALSGFDPNMMTCEELSEILFRFFKVVDETPVLNILSSSEIEILTRKLPQEVWSEHLHQDNTMVEDLISVLQIEQGKNIEAFSAAFRAIYFSTLHKNQIDAFYYDEALKLLIHGLVIQLMR